MESKVTKDGEAKCVFTLSNERAVRNSAGIICRFIKPTKYSGQDKRYDQELDEVKANQELVADAFNTIKKCDMMPSELLQQNATLIEQNKKLRNKLSELYEAYGSAVDITPELLQSVHQLLNEAE